MYTIENKTILVTGGAGFIGSHLCESLLEKGAIVISFDNLSQGKDENITHLLKNKNFITLQGDCNLLADCKKVFESYSIDYVFHYAATVGVKRTTEDPLLVLQDIEGIKNIMSLSHKHGIKKVMFASSSEVYGEPVEIPEKEDGIINAKIPYAHVKLVGESYGLAYWKKYNLPTVSLRFFNVFGPRQESSDYGFVVGIFIRQILDGQAPTVVGNGEMTRSFVYVKDNVQAAIAALLSEKTDGEVMNIGSDNKITILELAEKIIALSGKKLLPEFVQVRNNHEILHRQPDLAKMHTLAGYQSKYSLEEGLKDTYSWYQTYETR